MVERRDTSVTRHAGGWIVLGAGLLLVSLRSLLAPDAHPFDSPDASSIAGNSKAGAVAAREFPILNIDLNEASEAELSCVPGVGPALAHRIVTYRCKAGRFTSLDELDRIPGVGPQLAAQLSAAALPLEHSTPAGPAFSISKQDGSAASEAPAAREPTSGTAAVTAQSAQSASEHTILVGQHVHKNKQD